MKSFLSHRLTGKLKHTKAKTEKVAVNEEPQEEKTGAAVDQIKKKYGYASSVVSILIQDYMLKNENIEL